MTARKRCVVAGASGLIGSELVSLLAEEYEVHAVSRSQPRYHCATVFWHRIDFSGEKSDLRSLPARTDKVVYLAQSHHFRDFPARAADIFSVNVAALLGFLEYSRIAGADTFVFASSGGVRLVNKKLEDASRAGAPAEIDFYLSTKLCGEILASAYAGKFRLAILRYFFVYGPGQRRQMLVPRLIERIGRGEPIVLQGDDGVRLNPVHVVDAAQATRKALELGRSCTVDIAGPDVLSLKEMSQIIGEALGRQPVFRVEPPGASADLVGDIRAMRELLCEPRIRFDIGVRTML